MVPASFCERYFGLFLFAWGCLLELDAVANIHSGLFFAKFEEILPGWAWGFLMIGLAAGRYLACRFGSTPWRLRLSGVTLALCAVILMIAGLAKLFASIVPLSAFITSVAWWCHGNLARDIAAERRLRGREA